MSGEAIEQSKTYMFFRCSVLICLFCVVVPICCSFDALEIASDCLSHTGSFFLFSHVFPCACYILSSQEKQPCSLFAQLWRCVCPSCAYVLVEFAIHSVADEDTIEVEAVKGTTLLEVCQNEAVDITGSCSIRVSRYSCLRWRW